MTRRNNRYDTRYGRTQAPRTRRGGRASSYDEELRARESRRAVAPAAPPAQHFPRLLGIALVFMACVLIKLQIIDGPGLTRRANAIYAQDVTLSAKRGTIYDRNGNVLAMSVECRDLVCNPSTIADKNSTAEVLAEKLGGDKADYLEIVTQNTTYAYIKRQVDTSVAREIISELSSRKIDGVYGEENFKRIYPYDGVAGQVLGFIGTDGHGLSGLELQYDELLSGENGTKVLERGLDGTPIAGGAYEVHEATNGTDIIVSLDVNVQRVAEEQLTQAVEDASAKSGNVVVTDPETGEILAAASLPLYNPTDSSTLTNEALKLTAVSDSYEPGSTFKTLTMAIGYDTGTINANSTFTVPAKVKVGDDLVGDDDNRSETMEMTPHEIMRRSSNAGAAMVGYAIGAEKLASGLERFGIGSKTGVDFPGEVEGLVTKLENYTGATAGATAFGQGIAFPSVQLVRAVGAIANKGVLTTPHFLVQKGDEKVDWGEGTRAISEEAAALVTNDMVGVVDAGTGKSAAVEGYTVAGKTGTGEQASTEGGYVEDHFLSSFVGFANADSPSVLVYVGIYGTAQHGGTAAAPAFSAIMSEALTDLGVKPSK